MFPSSHLFLQVHDERNDFHFRNKRKIYCIKWSINRFFNVLNLIYCDELWQNSLVIQYLRFYNRIWNVIREIIYRLLKFCCDKVFQVSKASTPACEWTAYKSNWCITYYFASCQLYFVRQLHVFFQFCFCKCGRPDPPSLFLLMKQWCWIFLSFIWEERCTTFYAKTGSFIYTHLVNNSG